MDAKTGFLEINGIEFPYPSRDGLKITCTTLVDAGRNANGMVIGEPIGREQYKYTLKWSWLSAADWSAMCTEFAKFYLTVKILNPTTNSIQTLTMYPGDRNASPYYIDTDGYSVLWYKDATCNLIDMGEQ